jgi:hypothetical protein
MDRNTISSYLSLVGLLLVAAVIIFIAVFLITYGLVGFSGVDKAEATMNNYNNAIREQVTFAGYYSLNNPLGHWDGYFISTDGRRFYANSGMIVQNETVGLNKRYEMDTYRIELDGFPDNAWGIKDIVGIDQ